MLRGYGIHTAYIYVGLLVMVYAALAIIAVIATPDRTGSDLELHPRADGAPDIDMPLRLLAELTYVSAAAQAPAAAGAYVLAIEIERPAAVRIAGKPAGILGPGRYLYCGSARGPGGLRARLARHMRRRKSVRWHVDQLTTRGRVLGAWIASGRSECELVGALAHLPSPIPGFGSTDCACCASHLLRWPA